LFFTLALTAKAACVTLPFAVLGINTLLLRRPMRKSIWSLVPWFAVAAIWAVIALMGQSLPREIAEAVPVWKRPLLAADSLTFYVKLMLWPRNMVPIYPRSPALVVQTGRCWLDLLLVCAAFAAVVYTARRGYRVLPSIIVLFTVPLLPVLGLVPFIHQQFSSVADRFLYLSVLAIAIVYAWMWLAASTHPIPRARRSLAAGLVLVAIGHALQQTPTQVRSWASTEALLEHQRRYAPGGATMLSTNARR
jgi:hypothetical protein